MTRNDLSVNVEIDIHKVSCEGVWLCRKGDVTLRIRVLEDTARTSKKPPVFPVIYHEKFIFHKTFPNAYSLVALQQQLAKEIFHAELTQWPESKHGVVLAKFETTLEELLFPTGVQRGDVSGARIDLLMEPGCSFPGILSPKIEVSTKVTIGERMGERLRKKDSLTSHGQNMWCCKLVPLLSHQRHGIRRQKKVCHCVVPAPCLSRDLWSQVDDQVHRSKSSSGIHHSGTSLLPSSPLPEDEFYDTLQKFGPGDDYKNHMVVCCPICSRYKTFFSYNIPDRLSCWNNSQQEKSGDTVRGSQLPYTTCERLPYPIKDTKFTDCSRERPYVENPANFPKRCSSTTESPSESLNDGLLDDESYRRHFYEALEEFYCKLYERAKSRAAQECGLVRDNRNSHTNQHSY